MQSGFRRLATTDTTLTTRAVFVSKLSRVAPPSSAQRMDIDRIFGGLKASAGHHPSLECQHSTLRCQTGGQSAMALHRNCEVKDEEELTIVDIGKLLRHFDARSPAPSSGLEPAKPENGPQPSGAAVRPAQ